MQAIKSYEIQQGFRFGSECNRGFFDTYRDSRGLLTRAALKSAEAVRAAASFRHRPGSQSGQLSCHRACGTYGCAEPTKERPVGSTPTSIPPSTGKRDVPRGQTRTG